MNSEPMPPQAASPSGDTVKLLAEPFAFALVTWPAVIGLLGASEWPLWVRITLAVWLAAMQLAAYSRGAGFGNIILVLSGAVALACLGHPSPWVIGWLPLLLIGLHAAQRARLKAVGWQATTRSLLGPSVHPRQPASSPGKVQGGSETTSPLPPSGSLPETHGE